jgi:hypothetical protein
MEEITSVKQLPDNGPQAWRDFDSVAAKGKEARRHGTGDARNNRASPFKTTGPPKEGRTFFHNEMSLSDTIGDASVTVNLMDHTPDAAETDFVNFVWLRRFLLSPPEKRIH